MAEHSQRASAPDVLRELAAQARSNEEQGGVRSALADLCIEAAEDMEWWGQAACGLAFDLGQLYQRAAEAVTEFEDFTGHATGYEATRHTLHRLGRALAAMSDGHYRQRDPLWWRLVYLDSLEHAGFRTGADDHVRKLLPGQPAWERAAGPTLAEEVERLRYERDQLRDELDAWVLERECTLGLLDPPPDEQDTAIRLLRLRIARARRLVPLVAR